MKCQIKLEIVRNQLSFIGIVGAEKIVYCLCCVWRYLMTSMMNDVFKVINGF